ncbi:MAG: transposase, partial [Thermoleophilia bacterium]|nr:transposase [Thermoleophilia bacterium]
MTCHFPFCRYGLRPPFAQERLALRDDGCVLYHLRRPWPHPQGPTCLVLEPLDFMRRLAALVPAPYAHTIRYHGAFANRARSRQQLP